MFIFHLMGALAEFERDLIRERTNAGLAAARARGCVGGPPKRSLPAGQRRGRPARRDQTGGPALGSTTARG
jgi:DNA invertase Pin-like site-specific DNA recombinase